MRPVTDIYPPLKALYRVTLNLRAPNSYEVEVKDPIEAADMVTYLFFNRYGFNAGVKHVERIES